MANSKPAIQFTLQVTENQMKAVLDQIEAQVQRIKEATGNLSVGGGVTGGGGAGAGAAAGGASGPAMAARSVRTGGTPPISGATGITTPSGPPPIMTSAPYVPITPAGGGRYRGAGGRFVPAADFYTQQRMSEVSLVGEIQRDLDAAQPLIDEVNASVNAAANVRFAQSSARNAQRQQEQADRDARWADIQDRLDRMRARRRSSFPSDSGAGPAAASAQRMKSFGLDWGPPVTDLYGGDPFGFGPAASAAAASINPASRWMNRMTTWAGNLSPWQQQFAHGALIAVGRSGGEYFNALTQERLTGRPDIGGQVGAFGSLVGGLGGAGIGGFFGGFGGIIGAGVGGQVGGAAAQFFAAPMIRNIGLEQRLLPVAAMQSLALGNVGQRSQQTFAWPGYGTGSVGGTMTMPAMTSPALGFATGFRQRTTRAADYITQSSFGGDKNLSATAEQLGEAYEAIADALIGAGIDPFTDVGEGVGLVESKKLVGYKKKSVQKTRTRRVPRTQTYTIPGEEVVEPFDIPPSSRIVEDLIQKPGRVLPGPQGGRSFFEEGLDDIFNRPANEVFKGIFDSTMEKDLAPTPRSTPSRTERRKREVVVPGRTGFRKVKRPDRTMSITQMEDVTENYTEQVDDPSQPIYETTYKPEKQRMTLVEQYGQRLAQRMGIGIDQAQRLLAPILSAQQMHRGNAADILGQFGPRGLAIFDMATNPFGQHPDVAFQQALSVTATLQSTQRALTAAGYQARGVGTASVSALTPALNAVGRLPGGRDSLLFQQLQHQQRGFLMQQYQEEDIVNYGIPSTQLQGQAARLNVMPFAPGNIFKNTVAQLDLNTKHIDTLKKRKQALSDSGDLSEAMELQLVSQMEGLKTANAQGIAQLSEGFENRLPALSAGRPAHFNRFNSMNLAALNLWHMSSPIRSFGAYGGTQLADQNRAFRAYGVDPSLDLPRSTTEGFNNGPLVKALRDLTRALEHAVGRTGPTNRSSGNGGSAPGSFLFN